MTSKALKLLLLMHTKGICWFIGIYAFIMALLLILFSYVTNVDTSWLPTSILYSPKIYLMVIGIIYPLITTKLYISQGLTRKQFFWAFLGAISILSIFILLPISVTIIYYSSISMPAAITHYLQMPLFFLIGWTSIVGFQMRKWYTSALGILAAIAMFHFTTTIPGLLHWSELTQLGAVLLLLTLLLLFLPRIISQTPIKS
jgi:hypothetical protein